MEQSHFSEEFSEELSLMREELWDVMSSIGRIGKMISDKTRDVVDIGSFQDDVQNNPSIFFHGCIIGAVFAYVSIYGSVLMINCFKRMSKKVFIFFKFYRINYYFQL